MKNTPLSKQVLYSSIITLIWIVLYKLLLVKYAEFFTGAYEIGEIFYALGTSVIASAIFYYIVVYRPQKQKHSALKTLISRRVQFFELDYILIKGDIYGLKKIPAPENLPSDLKEFAEVCEGILLTDKPPIIIGNPNYSPSDWFEYFDYYFSLEASNIRMLAYYWEEIPVEVKVLLEDLQTNTLHSGLKTYQTTYYSNKLSDLAGPLWNHLNILKSISETLNKTMRI